MTKGLRGIKGPLAAGLVAVAALALATVGLAERPSPTASVDADLARHRGRVHRPAAPRSHPTPAPTPTEDPGRQSGSSEGTGKHIEGTVSEHHDIHGSGAVSVTSGAVDEGDGGSDADLSRSGPPIRKRRR